MKLIQLLLDKVVAMYKPIIILVFAIACSISEHEKISTSDILTSSLLSKERIITNRLGINELIHNKLATPQFHLTSAADNLLSTDGGRELLSDLIDCAIPKDIKLISDTTGIEFFGGLGIATQWLNRPLDAQNQLWISACIISRINNISAIIPISMRGENQALRVEQGEKDGWPNQEGAFYGDIFTPISHPIIWAACSGRDIAHSIDRVCAKEDSTNPGLTKCGFIFTGECMQVCKEYKHGFYKDCRLGNHAIKEIITVYDVP